MIAFRSDERGGALFGVIIVVFLVSLLAVGILSLTLGARKTVEAQLTDMRDRLVAKSAIDLFLNQTVLALNKATLREGELAIDDQVIQLGLEYERGKINLNRAGFPLLSAIFAADGMAADEARRLAGAIIDWRDQDETPYGDYGAERDAYATAGFGRGPRNGPFESVGELGQILGADGFSLTCIAPILTVSSDIGQVDSVLWAEEVKRVFAWAEANNWEEFDGAVYAGESEISGQVVTIVAQFGDNSEKKFQATYRIKSTADRSYEQLTPVRRIVAIPPSC